MSTRALATARPKRVKVMVREAQGSGCRGRKCPPTESNVSFRGKKHLTGRVHVFRRKLLLNSMCFIQCDCFLLTTKGKNIKCGINGYKSPDVHGNCFYSEQVITRENSDFLKALTCAGRGKTKEDTVMGCSTLSPKIACRVLASQQGMAQGALPLVVLGEPNVHMTIVSMRVFDTYQIL